MSDHTPEFDDLPDLPDLDDVPELPDSVEEIPDLPDEAEMQVTEARERKKAAVATSPPAPRPKPRPAPAPKSPAAAPAPGPVPPLAEGERPPLRELDKAPKHLRTAAVIAVAGSLLPWMGHGGGLLTSVGAKVVALLGVYFWFQQVKHNWGPKLSGAFGKLAEIDLKPKPKEEDKPKRRSSSMQKPARAIEHPFPTALHLGSLVLILAACVGLPLMDKTEGMNVGIAMAELGLLAWAAYTWVHIYAYERWGNFNPIFPLMFLAMVLAGGARLAVGFGEGFGSLEAIATVLGGGLLAAGGVLAAWTIIEAMMQAKKEGDIKKQAAIEARKAARKTRR